MTRERRKSTVKWKDISFMPDNLCKVTIGLSHPRVDMPVFDAGHLEFDVSKTAAKKLHAACDESKPEIVTFTWDGHAISGTLFPVHSTECSLRSRNSGQCKCRTFGVEPCGPVEPSKTRKENDS